MFSVCAVARTEESWPIRSWIVDIPSVSSAIAGRLFFARLYAALQLAQLIGRNDGELHPRRRRELIRLPLRLRLLLLERARFLGRRQPRGAFYDHRCRDAPWNLGAHSLPSAILSLEAD